MRVLFVLQGLWSLLWALLAVLSLGTAISLHSVCLGLVATFYVVATFGLLAKSKYAWGFSFIPPIWALCSPGPSIVANGYAFAIDDPLYLDSPGTIMVVGLEALVVLVPAIVLLLLLLRTRRVVFA
jgi:hypothetical protein